MTADLSPACRGCLCVDLCTDLDDDEGWDHTDCDPAYCWDTIHAPTPPADS